MHDTPRIKGVLSPVVTPFDAEIWRPMPNGSCAECQWLLSQNVGLAMFGTNSEANSLAVEEKIELMEGLIDRGLARRA